MRIDAQIDTPARPASGRRRPVRSPTASRRAAPDLPTWRPTIAGWKSTLE